MLKEDNYISIKNHCVRIYYDDNDALEIEYSKDICKETQIVDKPVLDFFDSNKHGNTHDLILNQHQLGAYLNDKSNYGESTLSMDIKGLNN